MNADDGYYCNGDCIDTDGDGVCDLDELEGCTDGSACNFVLGATNEDGSCVYSQQYYNCQGVCENDDDGDGTCDELEEGCTDETADNYNPQALNSTNCIYLGCMDNTSGNYNPMATQDDGSCIPAEACPYDIYLEYSPDAISYNANLCVNIIVEGCTDNTAVNYNFDANVDNESCEFIYDCIDQGADNYNAEATTDDGSCIYYGCMDPTAANYDEIVNIDDGSCFIVGCMNTLAENYNSLAVIDDNCIITGCTLPVFPNYNSEATIDDESCNQNSLDVFGCSDISSLNFNPSATIENGSCLYIGQLYAGGIIFKINTDGSGLVAELEDRGPMNYYEAIAQSVMTAGFEDWYLPSYFDIEEMYYSIGLGGDNSGGFEDTLYWCSTSASPQYSNSFNAAPYDDTAMGHNLGNQYKVRLIRAF